MDERSYHRERERQCRNMADKATADEVRNRHMALAELHHRLSEDDEQPLGLQSSDASSS